jgi:hypothetical protein
MPVESRRRCVRWRKDYSQTANMGTRFGARNFCFDTAKMFVPIISLKVLAHGLNALIGRFEPIVAPKQAETAWAQSE